MPVRGLRYLMCHFPFPGGAKCQTTPGGSVRSGEVVLAFEDLGPHVQYMCCHQTGQFSVWPSSILTVQITLLQRMRKFE